MATWKKVIVSGSSANLAALQVDNLTSGQVVIGGGSSNLTTRAISGSGAILASGGSGIQLSGSFSGSFQGDGSQLTGVVATNPNSITNGEGISSFSYNGLTAQTVSVSGAVDLTANSITKWDNTANKFANSSLTDNGTTISGTTSIVLTGANSSLTGSFNGNLTGTATTASYVNLGALNQNVVITGSLILSGSSLPELRVIGETQFTGSVSSAGGFTGSLFGTASYATLAGQVVNSLTAGSGLTGTTYNGSAASTFAVGAGALITVNADDVQVATSSLTTNQIPKYSANTLAGSNISDTGTQVQIAAGASSGLSVAAGGITVTGNSTFNNNVTVTGDLTVAGTASFQNTQNLLIGDRFAALASGSTSLTDGGIIVVSATGAQGMSGSAFYLESTSAGTYGRFATAYNVHASASSVTADEYMVSVKLAAGSNPVDATPPTWGSSTNGQGNMWINTTSGDIYIYS
jgi:hypothetical protein